MRTLFDTESTVDDGVPSKGISAAALDAQNVIALRAAVLRLPPEYREALVLQVGMGYSAVDIAAILDLPLPVVHARLCEARKRLRATCDYDSGSDPPE